MQLFHSLDACGAMLLRAIARYLDADEEQFAQMINGGNSVLRAIRYRARKSRHPHPGRFGQRHVRTSI